jgi:DICT domain-containing protein
LAWQPRARRRNAISPSEDADTFSIGELSRRTGVRQATLRTWEARYGQPRALPRTTGHRRYDESAVAAVGAILSHRASGLTMEAAVARATPDETAAPSVFAGLRERYPDLVAQRLSKRTLLALTRAIEDEYAARAAQAVLFAAFQQEPFLRRSESRWRDLASTAEFTAVFAAFDDEPTAQDLLHVVPLSRRSPLRREWVLVCDSPGHAACLAGWERPGQAGRADADRDYETLWSLDPRVVRTAARICLATAAPFWPREAEMLEGRLADTPAAASRDLRRANSLFQRVVEYVDAPS